MNLALSCGVRGGNPAAGGGGDLVEGTPDSCPLMGELSPSMVGTLPAVADHEREHGAGEKSAPAEPGARTIRTLVYELLADPLAPLGVAE